MSLSRSRRLVGLGLATLALALASLFLDRTSPVLALAPKNLELVGSVGGSITSVAPTGTIVFAGHGYSLASLDVGDPAHIAMLSTVLLPDFAVRVQISGTDAYIADGTGGLQIVDVADPLHMQWRGGYATNGTASDIATVGNVAYVATVSSSDTCLQIVNVANAAVPAYVASYCLGHAGKYAALDVVGGTAFLGDRLGLNIIDVVDPAHPAKLGGLSLSNGARDVRVTGDQVISVGDGSLPFLGGELDVIDAHTPVSPTLIGKYMGSGVGPSASALDVVANKAYVGGAHQGLSVFDLTVPTTPTLVNQFSFSASDIKVIGSRGFLASSVGSLQVIDFNLAPSSALIGEFARLARVWDVQLSSPYAFTTEYTQILNVVDATNLQSPVVLPAGPFPGYGRSVLLNDNVAYINRYNYGVDTFSIEIPSNPVLLASYNPAGHGSYTAITLVGNYAYVGELGIGVNTIDVSNPASPKYVTSVGPISGSGPQAMKRVGDILYIAAGNGGLVTVNVADPLHPTILGRDGNLWAAGLDVAKNLAFVSAPRDGVYVFDVTNPISPIVQGKYSTASTSLGKVLAIADRVFVAESGIGLLVLNVRNPAHPTLDQEYPILCSTDGFDVVGDFLYVACGAGGLRIFRLPGINAVTESNSYLPLLTR